DGSRRRNHFIAPVGVVAGVLRPHRTQEDRRVDGAHGVAKLDVPLMTATTATDAVDVLGAVASPRVFPAVRHAVGAATGRRAPVNLVAELPVFDPQGWWVSVVDAQLRPTSGCSPIGA